MQVIQALKNLLRRGSKTGRPVAASSAPGATPVPGSGDDLISVRYHKRELRFTPFGGKIEARLRSGKLYEGEFLQYIEALAIPGAYVDAGAYVGTHALFFATYCPMTRVYAFEPRQRCFDLISKNCALNPTGAHVELHHLGLSDQPETVTTRMDGRQEIFECKRLDAVVTEPVSVIKMDVEGMERKVLGGAHEILTRDKPLVFLEAHTREEAAENEAFLRPYGYEPTGRVFNASPTYEFAAATSPTAPTGRLLEARGLLDLPWAATDGNAEVSREGGKLVMRWPGGKARVSHGGAAGAAPTEAHFKVATGKTHFLQLTGEVEGTIEIRVVLFNGATEIKSTAYGMTPQCFRPVAVTPETTTVRFVLESDGPARLVLEHAALHVQR